MKTLRFSQFIFIISILIIGCGDNERKIYKKFDVANISEVNASDEIVSAFEGGEGFEELLRCMAGKQIMIL